jgi:hypothetical protein
MAIRPAARPCGSCPYRKDVPSGIWDPSEYLKLRGYDGETFEQAPNLFFCHQQNGKLCAGWVGCHDMYESLAIRIAASGLEDGDLEAILSYESPIELFDSGAEAADHGLRDVENPHPEAVRKINTLTQKRQRA